MANLTGFPEQWNYNRKYLSICLLFFSFLPHLLSFSTHSRLPCFQLRSVYLLSSSILKIGWLACYPTPWEFVIGRPFTRSLGPRFRPVSVISTFQLIAAHYRLLMRPSFGARLASFQKGEGSCACILSGGGLDRDAICSS